MSGIPDESRRDWNLKEHLLHLVDLYEKKVSTRKPWNYILFPFHLVLVVAFACLFACLHGCRVLWRRIRGQWKRGSRGLIIRLLWGILVVCLLIARPPDVQENWLRIPVGIILFGYIWAMGLALPGIFKDWIADPFGSSGRRSERLWEAAGKGDLGRVRELIAQGVDVNRPTEVGGGGDSTGGYFEAPLIPAAGSGSLDVVVALVEAGAKVNVADSDERITPLREAVAIGHIEIVKYLLGKGAAVNARTAFKETVLMLAAQKSLAEIVKVLLAKGADPGRRDLDGKTALDLAKEAGHSKIVAILERAIKDKG